MADAILARLKELALQKNNPVGASIAPDAFCYNMVLASWSQSGEDETAAKRLWELYEEMKGAEALPHIAPDASTHSTLIFFYSKSNERQFAERAEALLQQMEDNNYRPNFRHYSAVMKGWINVGDAPSAQRVFEKRIDHYINGHNEGARPVPSNYDLITRAYVEAGDVPGAISFIDKIQDLQDTEKLPEGPNLQTCNYLLDACRASMDRKVEAQIPKINRRIEELLDRSYK